MKKIIANKPIKEVPTICAELQEYPEDVKLVYEAVSNGIAKGAQDVVGILKIVTSDKSGNQKIIYAL